MTGKLDHRPTPPLLIVTAVEAEADAIRAGLADNRRNGLGNDREDRGDCRDRGDDSRRADLDNNRRDDPGNAHRAAPGDNYDDDRDTGGDYRGRIVVAVVGVGIAAAAAGTARLLATGDYRGVISAGIAGGFAPRAPVGATVIGTRSIAADLGAESADGFLPIDELGFGSAVLRADAGLTELLADALPDAVPGDVLTLSTVTGTQATANRLTASYPQAVAEAMEGFGVAVAAAGLPFAELRTISNPVGPRDRASWRLKEAFAALSTASAALWTACG